MAVAAAIAAPAFAAAGAPRHIKLEAEPPEGARRFLSALKNLSLDGDRPTTWETVTRTGTFYDPRYGEFDITQPMLLQMVENFEKRTYGQDIFIDVAHEPSKGAAAKVLKLEAKDGRLRALLEWTPYGVEAVKNRGFRYLSAEYMEDFQDNEKRARHGALLLGAGLTVRPVIKGLDGIEPNKLQLATPDSAPPTLIHPDLQTHLLSEVKAMWKDLIARLLKTLSETHKLGAADVKILSDQAEATLAKVTDKAVAEVLIGALENAGKQLADARAAGQTGTIQLAINMPAAGGLDEAGVKALMERVRTEQEKSATTLAETQKSRRALLATTIHAATGIPEQDRKELIEAVQDLVTAETSEDHVKRLAATQVASGNKLIAARQLAGLGYHVQGSPSISVDSSNEIKSLQDEVDKRIFTRMSPQQRYMLSEGKAIEGNKLIVEEALKLYDQQNGRRLHQEYKAYKQLAAGDGIVSDVAVPAIFERTVIREALTQLVGLQLCDVGTHPFTAVVQIPYSFRDTTAAGKAAARVYEGGAVARAGVKQTIEEARPIPQKLAFEVSDEMRYLVGNGQLNFDIVAENARNAVRIIGEDTEGLVFDEHLRASDELTVVNVVGEATGAGNGANKIFPVVQFPVLRPRKVFDLQGVQVGATLYPITVTVNAVNRPEYDGTGLQAAGIYWTMNYNLGELNFVNELGVATAVTNAHAIVASYSYTTNVYKFDTDLGALAVDAKYDDFLYRFGLRKAAVEDRGYQATVATMSGTLRTQIEQARQFGANFKRQGTDLLNDGNLGRIKDVPAFRSYAPGLAMGDNRVVVGERGTIRFRMVKPWTMGQLQDQKNAAGRFTGKKEAFGDQFIVVYTPSELRKAFTSMVLFSTVGRVARVA